MQLVWQGLIAFAFLKKKLQCNKKATDNFLVN